MISNMAIEFMVVLALALVVDVSAANFTYIGEFKATNAGYNFVYDINNDDELDLCILSFQFDPLATGALSFVDNLKNALPQIHAGNQPFVQNIDTKVFWPNDLKVAPSGMFTTKSNTTTLLLSDGFIIAGKTPGNVYAIIVDDSGNLVSSTSLTGTLTNVSHYGKYFTMADVVDLGEPTKDILATRDIESIFGSHDPALVLLMHPVGSPLGTWEERVLVKGIDFSFAVCETLLPGKDLAVYGGGFFKPTLDLVVLDTNEYPPLVKTYTIDTTIHVFSVQWLDLDGDGVKELLVSNNVGKNGSLLVYEIPADPTDVSGYVKHVVASGFNPYHSGPGMGAPGFPLAIHLNKNDTGPMHILLSGDDNGGLYLLSPQSGNGKFDYSVTNIHQIKGTIGRPDARDVNGDGWVEIFSPDYQNSKVSVFTTKPPSA